MKFLLVIGFIAVTKLFAQDLTYSPGSTVSKTIDKFYYDTEYLNFTYNGDSTYVLHYQTVKDSSHKSWHRALCTNLICYTDVPKEGQLGTFENGGQGYLAISLSTGDNIGTGTFKFRIYSANSDAIDDTVAFKYEVLDSEKIINQPWVKIDVQENVVFVLFKNAQLKSTFEIYNLRGNLIKTEEVNGAFSYALSGIESGVYIVRIKSETGQEMVKRIVKL